MFPTLLKFGNFEITTFGFMMFLGFMVGGLVLGRQFRRSGLGDEGRFGPFTRFRNCRLAAGTVVRSHCDLEGVITHGACVIGPFARLRPGTELAEGVHIGNFVETKQAAIGVGSKANHLSYLGDVVIGVGANIGAGTITCNYDGANKHPTRIGDGAFIGSNSSLVAPVNIGVNATIRDGLTIGHESVIGAGSLILKDAEPFSVFQGEASEVSRVPSHRLRAI